MARKRSTQEGNGQRVRHAWGIGVVQYGIIGWTVAVPILIGAALGYWIDSTGPGGIYWTILLMLAGLALGVAAAWLWMRREIRYDRSL